MKEITKSRWKKFGYFCMSFLPLLLYFVITFGVATVMSIFIAIYQVMQGAQVEEIVQGVLHYGMEMGTVYAVLGIICLGLWYYFGCKCKNLKLPKGVLTPKNMVLIFLLTLALQYVVSYCLTIFQLLAPSVVENYNELMEMAGLTEITLWAVIYGVILGPIAEELVFRGVTLYYAKKFTNRFWLANILQAVTFGVLHANLVQGTYAFLLGLVLGLIYERFHSLYASIFMHICFNFLGVVVLDGVNRMLPESLAFTIIWSVAMTALAVATFWLLWKGKNYSKEDSSSM